MFQLHSSHHQAVYVRSIRGNFIPAAYIRLKMMRGRRYLTLHIAVYGCYRVKCVHNIKVMYKFQHITYKFLKNVNIYFIRHFMVLVYVIYVMVMDCMVQYREMCYIVNRSCHTAVCAVLTKQNLTYSCLCCIDQTQVAIQLSVLYRPNASCHTAICAV